MGSNRRTSNSNKRLGRNFPEDPYKQVDYRGLIEYLISVYYNTYEDYAVTENDADIDGMIQTLKDNVLSEFVYDMQKTELGCGVLIGMLSAKDVFEHLINDTVDAE